MRGGVNFCLNPARPFSTFCVSAPVLPALSKLYNQPLWQDFQVVAKSSFSFSITPFATARLIIACSAELIGRGCLSARVLPHPHCTQYAGASRSRPAPARDQNPCLEQLSAGDVLRAIPATETAILPRQLRRRHAARSSGPMSLEPLVVRNRRFATFAVRPNASGSFVFPGLRRDDMVGSETRNEHDWITGSQAGTISAMGTGRSLSSGLPKAGPLGRCDEKG
jgi:hypothetical protein